MTAGIHDLKTVWVIKQALGASHWPLEKLRQRQEALLRHLLIHAYQNVPLYRILYHEAGFRPEDFHSLEDLKKIPILSKERLKSATPQEVIVRGVDPTRCKVVRTSGSTGTPLRLFLRSEDECWQRATAWRILFEHGFRWTFRTLQIDTTPRRNYFIQKLGIAPKDWMSPSDPPDHWIEAMRRRKYEVLVATASVLHTMSETILSKGIEIPTPKILVSDDETLIPATRELARRAFHIEPIDVYGLCELSNFVWQCEVREGYHVSADSHIVEVTAPPGEIGSVIVTALGMKTMPFIRYDTGDLAEASNQSCVCGRTLPMLTCIWGRAVDSVILPDKRKLLWPFFYDCFSRYDDLSQWQVIQLDPYHIEIKLVTSHDGVSLVKQIKTHLRKALPEEIEINVVRVSSISTRPGEKVRMVISKVGPDP